MAGRSRKKYAPRERELYKVNRRIRAREVFLIDEKGVQVGPTPIKVALQKAQAAGLDLVEVAPQSRPPVAKILDYGRFKYEQKKKAKGKPKSNTVNTKEVRVRPKIDVNDLNIKSRKAREFLEAGHKVQVTCMFRGREMAYQSIGREVMLRLAESLEDLARVERMPKMEGRRMHLVLSKLPPGSKAKPRPDTSALNDESKASLASTGASLPTDHLKVTNNDDFADLPSVPAKPAEPDDDSDSENND